MPASILLLLVFAYIFVLFALARIGDTSQGAKKGVFNAKHPAVYALALGVYCTSWTFYGLVGTASTTGWNFFPILLGPILLFTIGYPLLERIYKICRQEHTHSVADFIASRYGKRQSVAATVSVVVLIATIPYIALQLKAVSDTLLLTLGDDFFASQNLTFLIAVCMAVFTLLFGVRRLDVSGYHSGLMTVIAFESLIKLLVLLSIAFFCVIWMADPQWQSSIWSSVTSLSLSSSHHFHQPMAWSRFLVETLLAMCAIFCLPRMFHVTFVECLSLTHLRSSRGTFVTYLLLITACIVIIAIAGNAILGHDDSVSADTYVIALPMSQGSPWVAMLAFLGGFSAATAMIIVSTMTLSHMLSNDVVLPIFLRGESQNKVAHEFSQRLIFSRRLTVVFVVFAAYLYQILLAENTALTSIGLVAFALIVQLAPAILFGLYWKIGNASGLYAGLFIGLLLWFYTLMMPLLASAGFIDTDIIEKGIFEILWLRPEYLLGMSFGDSFTRAVVISTLANILFYVIGSLISSETLADKVQAAAFTQLTKGRYNHHDDINVDDLRVLLCEFVDESTINQLFLNYPRFNHEPLENLPTHRADNDPSSGNTPQQLVDKSQKILAGIVGIASAQAMIERVCQGKKMAVEEVVNLFGETTKALRFKQQTLSTSFEYISSGISVVDKDMRLVAWNSRYEEIFDYPRSMLYVGISLDDVMRFNVSRHLFDENERVVSQRFNDMLEGKEYRIECRHHSGKVFDVKGRPLPDGGYVTTYDDITSLIEIQQGLKEANATLEERVKQRTQIIDDTNASLLKEILRRGEIEIALREAKQSADAANDLKTKFLALASHDIMQPLNAASLYASALSNRYDSDQAMNKDREIIEKLQSSIRDTESIIATLLEISKADHGDIHLQKTVVSLNDMLSSIVTEVNMQLTHCQVLRYSPTSIIAWTDQHYLRRIIQNLVSNAIKYTPSGKVLLGCRRIQNKDKQMAYVDICIWDTGIGISEQDQQSIFSDFYRVTTAKQNSVTYNHVPGVGLGLSVVKRFSQLLDHPLRCRSVVGKGSCFSIRVPVANHTQLTPRNNANNLLATPPLTDMVVAYMDDEPENLTATEVLLDRWQCKMVALSTVTEARKYSKQIAANSVVAPDILLMDYQLGLADIDGMTLAEEIQQRFATSLGYPLVVCIVSGSLEPDLPDRVSDHGFEFLRKPVKPARLRALLSHINERRYRTDE